MADQRGKRTRKQEEAIVALLTSSTMTAAAERVGIGIATLVRWMKDPAFTRAYQDARREVTTQALGTLTQACSGAVATLQQVMDDPVAPAAARVTAAKTVLDFAIRAVALEDLTTRLAEVEAQLGGA
jgi:hypothetical protein